jgi:hypothetical protein
MRFIEPMVKERFEKMDKLGEAWEDPPVRDPVPISVLSFMKWKNRTIC